MYPHPHIRHLANWLAENDIAIEMLNTERPISDPVFSFTTPDDQPAHLPRRIWEIVNEHARELRDMLVPLAPAQRLAQRRWNRQYVESHKIRSDASYDAFSPLRDDKPANCVF